MRSVDVAIVGGGPAGLVLALLLGRSGREVALVEQNATFEREYRGEGLQPGTRRIFAELGLARRIEALDHGSPRALLARIDGRESRIAFAAFLGDDPAARSIFVPQPPLLEILAEAAGRASARIEMGTAFRALRTEAGRVRGIEVARRDGTAGSIDARLVVACDGRFSAVRRAAGLATRAARVPYDLLWFSAGALGDANDLVYLQVGGPHVALAFPSRERSLQIGWLIPKGAAHPPNAALIERAPPEAAASLARSLGPSARTVRLPIASEIASAWSVPGLLLIGDAAHPMSPVAAQGINVAIADAVIAARHIAPALEQPSALDAALDAIERERAGSVRRVARQQNALPAALHRFGPALALRGLIAVTALVEHLGLFPYLGRPFLDRFLWGDPAVSAACGPWMREAKDSSGTSR